MNSRLFRSYFFVSTTVEIDDKKIREGELHSFHWILSLQTIFRKQHLLRFREDNFRDQLAFQTSDSFNEHYDPYYFRRLMGFYNCIELSYILL